MLFLRSLTSVGLCDRYKWRAPSRPFVVKKTRLYSSTAAAVVVVIWCSTQCMEREKKSFRLHCSNNATGTKYLENVFAGGNVFLLSMAWEKDTSFEAWHSRCGHVNLRELQHSKLGFGIPIGDKSLVWWYGILSRGFENLARSQDSHWIRLIPFIGMALLLGTLHF